MSRADSFFARLPQSSIRLGFDRIVAACAALGDPHRRFPAILVAGTNGKGSTCACLEAALRAAGRRVGLYTSPHLVSPRERIRIDGEPIGEAAFDEAVERLCDLHRPAAEPGHPDAPTYFEAMTAIAFDRFARSGVEVAVLEVGLGGRLDATNLPGTDLRAAVVTRIGLDHVDWLGGTLAAIAAEKGAIARAGIPLVIGPQEPEARKVLLEVAAGRGALPIEVGRDAVLVEAEEGLRFEGRRWRIDGIRIGMRGAFQRENAAVALATLEAVAESFGVGPEAARAGIAAARWPGRLEVVARDPEVVLDGAHNPDGARALVEAFRSCWPGVRPRLVFGVLGDKERGPMMEALLPLAAKVHLCTPDSPRAVPAEALLGEAKRFAAAVEVHGSTAQALAAARGEAGANGVVLVCGSLFLVGEARRLLCGSEPAR